MWRGPVKFANFDTSTNELEVFVSGLEASTLAESNIYKLNRSSSWPIVTTLPSPSTDGVRDIEIFDYNEDGLLDFVVIGWDMLKIFRNDGNNNYTLVYDHPHGYIESSITVLDYDNDGDLDVYFTGQKNVTGTPVENGFLQNNGGTFSAVSAASSGLPALTLGDSAAGVLDPTGLHHMVLTGSSNSTGQIGRVYQNNGDGTFTHVHDIADLIFSTIEIADAGGSALNDIIVMGDNALGRHTIIYETLPNLNFDAKTSAFSTLPDVAIGAIKFADLNNDGRKDVVILGRALGGSGNKVTQIRLGGATDFVFNGGTISLKDASNATIFLDEGTIDIADYNLDGTLDILLNGNAAAPPVNQPRTYLFTQCEVYYADADGDGHGNPNVTQSSCTGPPTGYVLNNNDSDDTDPCSENDPPGYVGYDPDNPIWQAADCDGDGYTNIVEHNAGTDPYDPSDFPLSVDEFDKDLLALYPNPTSGILNIKTDPSINIEQIGLHDMTGRLIFQTDAVNSIDMSQYASGIYLLKFISEQNSTQTYKIIKK